MKRNVFAVLALGGLVLLFASPALAQEAAGAVSRVKDYAVFAAALGMGLATFGGALGQGRTASSALEGIARNPGAAGSMFTPMILGLVLIESLVIYSFVIEIMILLFNR